MGRATLLAALAILVVASAVGCGSSKSKAPSSSYGVTTTVPGVGTGGLSGTGVAGVHGVVWDHAITSALPKWLRTMPVGCMRLDVHVSNDRRYASVSPMLNLTERPSVSPTVTASDDCVAYGSNGFYILRKGASGRWAVIFNGSVPPPCSLGVPRDLSGCTRVE